MLVAVWRSRGPWALLVGTQNGAAAVESSLGVPQIITNSMTSSSNSRVQSPKTEIRKICTPTSIAALFTRAKV